MLARRGAVTPNGAIVRAIVMTIIAIAYKLPLRTIGDENFLRMARRFCFLIARRNTRATKSVRMAATK